MSHTHFQNECTSFSVQKSGRKIIPTQMKERRWAYTAGVCQHQNIFAYAIGGMEDHIHMLLQFPATIVIADAIRDIKSNSSGWMSGEIGSFAWQQGYGGFGVSKSKIGAVVRYIQNQERHHRKMAFEEEFIALLKKHVLNTIRGTFLDDVSRCARSLRDRSPVSRLRRSITLSVYPVLTRCANFATRLRR